MVGIQVCRWHLQQVCLQYQNQVCWQHLDQDIGVIHVDRTHVPAVQVSQRTPLPVVDQSLDRVGAVTVIDSPLTLHEAGLWFSWIKAGAFSGFTVINSWTINLKSTQPQDVIHAQFIWHTLSLDFLWIWNILLRFHGVLWSGEIIEITATRPCGMCTWGGVEGHNIRKLVDSIWPGKYQTFYWLMIITPFARYMSHGV